MIEAAMAAHIQEHVAFAYRAGIEKELGVELPPPNEPLPEDIELRISRLAAPASAQRRTCRRAGVREDVAPSHVHQGPHGCAAAVEAAATNCCYGNL